MLKLKLKMSSAVVAAASDTGSLQAAKEEWGRQLVSQPELLESYSEKSVEVSELVRKVCAKSHGDLTSTLQK